VRAWAWSWAPLVWFAGASAAWAGPEGLAALQEAPRPAGEVAWRPPPAVGAAPAADVTGSGAYVQPPGTVTVAPRTAHVVRRGPVEQRDEWILAQPRLTLPALSPDPVGKGQWRARVSANRGNDFGWTQTSPGELPAGGDRRFLIDGEHQTTEASVRYGLSSTVDLSARLPIHWRGAGFMDGIIDVVHEAFEWAGFLDNKRPDFINDLYRVEGRSDAFVPFSWTEDDGSGLGNVELAVHWAFAGTEPGACWTWATVGRVTLPTATGVYEVGGVDVGLQLLAARRLGAAFDLYLGVGGTWFSEEEIDGVLYEQLRGSGFVALEWRPASTWSLIATVHASSNLVTNIALYPTFQSYVDLAAKIDLSRCWQLELGFTENLEDQQSTTDIGVFVGIVGRF